MEQVIGDARLEVVMEKVIGDVGGADDHAEANGNVKPKFLWVVARKGGVKLSTLIGLFSWTRCAMHR